MGTNEAKPLVISEGWLIWSNEHTAWWGPDWLGYKSNRDEAGRYSLADAADICHQAGVSRKGIRHGVPNEIMVPSPELLEKIDELAAAPPVPVPADDGWVSERQLIADLVGALAHMKVCASCGEGPWEDCDGGREALEVMARAESVPPPGGTK